MKLLLLLLTAASVWAGDVSLTVAGLRIMPERWNKAANLAKFERYAREAAAKGADLALAPEGFLEGYVGNTSANPATTEEKYRAVGEAIDGPSLRRLRDLARELKIHLGIGFAESRGGRMYNSFAVFGPAGDLVLHYSKAHNAEDEPFNTTGREFPVASTGGHGEMNDAMMRTRAFENSVWVAFVHPQRTLIIDSRGTIVAQDDGGGDQIVMARITLDSRIGKGAIRSRKPELYRELVR